MEKVRLYLYRGDDGNTTQSLESPNDTDLANIDAGTLSVACVEMEVTSLRNVRSIGAFFVNHDLEACKIPTSTLRAMAGGRP